MLRKERLDLHWSLSNSSRTHPACGLTLLFRPLQKLLHLGLPQNGLSGIQPPPEFALVVEAVQVPVAEAAEHQAAAGQLVFAEVAPEVILAVVFSGDEVVEGQRLLAPAEFAAGFAAQVVRRPEGRLRG